MKVQTNLRTKVSKRKPPMPKRVRSTTEEVVHAYNEGVQDAFKANPDTSQRGEAPPQPHDNMASCTESPPHDQPANAVDASWRKLREAVQHAWTTQVPAETATPKHPWIIRSDYRPRPVSIHNTQGKPVSQIKQAQTFAQHLADKQWAHPEQGYTGPREPLFDQAEMWRS